MRAFIQVPATRLDRPEPLEWPDFLAKTGLGTLAAHDLLRAVADVILEADQVFGIEHSAICAALAAEWPASSVMAAIDQTMNYIGGLHVYELYDGRIVIIPPAAQAPKEAKKDLPPRATIDEINAIMADLDMTPAQLGRALGASTKNASKSVYDWLRGVATPSRATTQKLRTLMEQK